MSNKELAVQLAAAYLKGFYSVERKTPLDPETAQKVLQMFYEAVKSLPDE